MARPKSGKAKTRIQIYVSDEVLGFLKSGPGNVSEKAQSTLQDAARRSATTAKPQADPGGNGNPSSGSRLTQPVASAGSAQTLVPRLPAFPFASSETTRIPPPPTPEREVWAPSQRRESYAERAARERAEEEAQVPYDRTYSTTFDGAMECAKCHRRLPSEHPCARCFPGWKAPRN